MDELLDINNDLFFNLILYYYDAVPPPQQPLISPSQPIPKQDDKLDTTEYTLTETSLCDQIASYTAMHKTQIINMYKQLKLISIDSFTINENTVKYYYPFFFILF